MHGRDADALSRMTTERLELELRRGVLLSRLADAVDTHAESEALRGQAQQLAEHAAQRRLKGRAAGPDPADPT